jgi:glycerate 2-kinase
LTGHLLACGASITEINTIRKRMSAVKGGKFALACAPAHVLSIVLSDIIGDPLDMIASGPAYPDSSTADDAREVLRKYPYPLSSRMQELISEETPKVLSNVTTFINGSVRELCHSACMTCKDLGYEPIMLTDRLCCEASEAGSFFSSIALSHQQSDHSIAFIAGGETVVHLKGSGSGGRNQEMALSASLQLQHCVDTCFFSIGSDGTDGPTDAAGGYADEHTIQPISSGNPSALTEQNALAYLANNDAYHALQKTGGLIITGPTGTNVNDLSVLLIQR